MRQHRKCVVQEQYCIDGSGRERRAPALHSSLHLDDLFHFRVGGNHDLLAVLQLDRLAGSGIVLVPVPLRDLLGRHPRLEDDVPVREVRLREVLLDTELLVVYIVVRHVVTEHDL